MQPLQGATMKRIFLPAVLALTLSGGFAMAQSADPTPAAAPSGQKWHHHASDPHREAVRISKRLNLSADQTAKLEPILADRDQKMAALKGNTTLSPQEKKQQMRTIHQDMKQQFDAVLTPEQIEQMKQMRHGHNGRGGAETPAPPPAGL
jgi:protein CpxP